MKKYIFLLIVVMVFVNCQEKQKPSSSNISVDIEQRDKVSVFDIFNKIEIIPLETNDSSLIIEIDKLIPYYNRFYLFDYKMQKVSVFDDTGKFLFNVGNKGGGPDEYFHISDFDIHYQKLSLVSPVDGNLISYDLEGGFLERYRLPDTQSSFKCLKYINNDTIAFWTFDYNNRLKLYSQLNKEFVKETMPEEDNIFNSFSTAVFPYNNYLARTIDNKVYEITLQGDVVVAYEWDFGKLNNRVKKLKVPDLSSHEKKIEYVKKIHASEVINYIFSEEGGNSEYVYTQLSRKNKLINIFYNKKSKENYVFEETSEKAKIFPMYWAEDYMIGICPDIENLTLDNILPDTILDEVNRIKKNSWEELDNPLLIKYYFKK
ncbi:6-bladed beta-propeller [Paludibacter sp. 221]|uniref:6-bladed beta-propeller n=1 Tax=Paludibacter sp. 221 TaxID=2302939 RepID=UPI0013D45793|nr:6-bladed beta-propeller [Paludibacter sp. 221]NDV46526.1 6-bladed beta-propeller [Paludibacter sp. 221]